MRLLRSRRGSADTIIATLLLIVVAVAGAVLVYRNMVSMGQSVGSRPSIVVIDKSLRVLGSGGNALLHFTVSNDGAAAVVPVKIYIIDPQGNNMTINLSEQPIAGGKQWSFDSIVAHPTGTYKQGETYVVVVEFAFVDDVTKTFTVQFDVIAL